MAKKKAHNYFKWVALLGVSIFYSISAMAEEGSLTSTPVSDAMLITLKNGAIPSFPHGSPFKPLQDFMQSPSTPLKLLGQVNPPCVSITAGNVTLSFSNTDIEEYVRMHTKRSSSQEDEMVEAVWAAIPPSIDESQCAKVPRNIPNYAYRDGRGQVALSQVIRNVLDHLLSQGKATARINTSEQPITTVYVRTRQADCPMCGRIPPWLMFYSLKPNSSPFWQGQAPREYERWFH